MNPIPFHIKHTTTLISLSNHNILSREWRVIVHQVQTKYDGRPMVLQSVRCDRAVDYEGLSLWSDVMCFNPGSFPILVLKKASAFDLRL